LVYAADYGCRRIQNWILGGLKFSHAEICGTLIKPKSNVYCNNAVPLMACDNVQERNELMIISVKREVGPEEG
jgi:hypothetical protein